MYIEIKRSKKLFWHYVVKAKNGEIMLSSETYFNKGNCVRAARRSAKQLGVPIEIKWLG